MSVLPRERAAALSRGRARHRGRARGGFRRLPHDEARWRQLVADVRHRFQERGTAWHNGAWSMEHVVRSGPNYTCGREPARLAENNTPGPTAKG